ncbi:MAG: lipid-binding SYLF domain-containing protein [candidate division NC10 bacterium]
MQQTTSHPRLVTRLTTFATVLAVALLASAPGPAAAASSKQQALVEHAKATFQDFVKDPDMGWFRDHLKESYGIVIFPQVVRAAFIFGAEGGSGVMVAHDDKKGWSDPAFYFMGSGSFGLQIGVQAAEIILMIKSKSGRDALLTGSFKLGGDVDVALGPVGAGAKVKTGSILAFARAKGIFGGISVDGAVVSTQDKWNQAYYDKEGIRPVDILMLRNVHNKQADALIDAVTEVTEFP